MENKLPTPPEYTFARALISYLRADARLADATFPEPWDREEQDDALALAAQQYDLALAVHPMPPEMVGEGHVASGVLRVRAALLIFATRQVSPGSHAEAQAALAGVAINRALGWSYESHGCPYTQPALLQVDALDTSSYPRFQNLYGTALTLGVPVNYRHYYAHKH